MNDRDELIKEYKALTKELYEFRALERIKEFELGEIERKLRYESGYPVEGRCY